MWLGKLARRMQRSNGDCPTRAVRSGESSLSVFRGAE